MNKSTTITAKTLAGMEEILAKELQEIGAQSVTKGNRMVKFQGDKKLTYKANYQCRTALRILLPFNEFRIKNQDDFYKKARAIPWEKYLKADATFSITKVIKNSVFTNSQYAVLRLKDAIADRFREKAGKRPSVDLDDPNLSINLHMVNNDVTLSLDSSGASLHKRGYRSATGPAPLNEVLAAGLILLTGWSGETDFYDPMCGSGTLPIEAAMIARNIPPGYYRQNFGFRHWQDFDPKLWQEVKKEADAHINRQAPSITGFDISNKLVQIARQNIRNAGLQNKISVFKKDFFKLQPASEQGIIVMNPPYDMRLKEEDTKQFYRTIGDTLKNSFKGFTAYIFSGNLDALKSLGLRPSRRIVLYNGPIESRLARYDLYEGSKRKKS
ncbi:MAG: class I SAM-dependent RNA methyltransferase [Bacteroidales bacterium]|nr:class I SAM-dependent RNA methyltransferase [Bacteroidales bacterium]